MMTTTVRPLSLAVLLGLSAQAQAALHHHVADERSQTAQSDLVFVGSVARVEYRQSGRQGDAQRVPHTFVTYNVEEVLRGKTSDKQVTLRFIGGRGEQARFLTVSGQPMFDRGDRDLLMVAGNGSSGCPLVGCSSGRYRLIQGKVFSEEGQAVEVDAHGHLTMTDYYELPEVMTHKVSQTTMRLVDHFEHGEQRVEFTYTDGGAHLEDSQLIERIRQQSRSLGLATPSDFRSADVQQAFDLSFEVSAPPSTPVARAPMPTRDLSPQERAEREALQRHDGNPAIGEYRPASSNGPQGE